MLGLLAMVVARMQVQKPVAILQGHVRVVDGDSLLLDGVRIRLQGIDAPELGQNCIMEGASWPCGREARAALAKLVDGGIVSCESYGQDRYGRILARCKAEENELNRAMVETGWAVAYGDFEAQESQARKERKNIWRGNFTRPQEWRRINTQPVELPHDDDPFQDLLVSAKNRLREFGGWLRGWIGF